MDGETPPRNLPAFHRPLPVIAWLLLAVLLPGAVVRADDAEDRFAVAMGHYAVKRWKFAVEEFKAFLEQYPDHADAAHPSLDQPISCVHLPLPAGRTPASLHGFRYTSLMVRPLISSDPPLIAYAAGTCR